MPAGEADALKLRGEADARQLRGEADARRRAGAGQQHTDSCIQKLSKKRNVSLMYLRCISRLFYVSLMYLFACIYNRIDVSLMYL